MSSSAAVRSCTTTPATARPRSSAARSRFMPGRNIRHIYWCPLFPLRDRYPGGKAMTTTTLTRHEIDVADVEYIRHGDKPLLARVYKPRGAGPFPLVIDLHGGAWCNKDRKIGRASCRERV